MIATVPLTPPRNRVTNQPDFAVAIADLDDRIVALEAALETLRRQRDAHLLAVIAHDDLVRKDGGLFAAVDLFDRQAVNLELRDAFAAVKIRSARVLGKRLERLASKLATHGIWGLTRVGENNRGALWSVRVIEDSHQASSTPSAPRV